MPPEEAQAASDTAATPAASAPAVAAPSPASAPAAATPAAAPAPAAPTTLLTEATATPEAEGTKPTDAPASDKDAATDADKDKPKTADEQHAPEEYADFELPEGATLGGDFLTQFKDTAKKLDLPQGKANELAKLAATEAKRLGEGFVSKLQETVDRSAQQWREATLADPELGGENHKAVMAVAAKALETFGSPELKQFLNESRLGSHPELIRLLHKAGKHISQDSVIPGRSTTGTKTDAEVIYGNKA